MQYIKKQTTPPENWDIWFTKATGERSFDYGNDYNSLTNLRLAREYLINEQHGLCAYCQQTISIENSSIEHVIAKEFNKELSTNYYNLVAVCRVQQKEITTNRFHCDREKGSKMISPLIFNSNLDVTKMQNCYYFSVYSDGLITPKYTLSNELKIQVEAAIEILNLNHQMLKEKRAKDVLDGLISAFRELPQHQKNTFWKIQFDRIFLNRKQPFRQFLLNYIGNKIGIN